METAESQKSVYFWDMDHTIINNDCDVSWKEFLHAKGVASSDAMDLAENFYQDYLNNCLDQDEFMDFQLVEFKGKTFEEMLVLSREHFSEVVKNKIYPQAEKEIRQQMQEGKLLCLITATNSVIAYALKEYLGFDHMIASELEVIDNKYTGKASGTYCLGNGKVSLMKDFFAIHGGSLASSSYYGDSAADVVILEQVGHPFAVNPAPKLLAAAELNNWPVISFT
ncbi:HAD-IB family hydrolase [Lentisphaera profundi]|uniref:HAD-IB family hydrolase n=1 Tax=Lentisphaera profundi TaxID=1658616 RepID=A0ABY7VZ34_9BACT|nr:HAD-IB family hydrolase [Lentisphaera profundi]WDE98051.1 HAD-IB family hydrolase [Lentisphaera profundi]